MKNKILKSALAFLLVFSMLIPTVYIAFAKTGQSPQITVSQVEGKAGETVKVEIALSNNPGIVSMSLRVNYDAEILTLKKFTDAGVLGAQSHKPELTSPHTLVWVNDTATENFVVNGTILTYEFEINENAPANSVYPIEVSYTKGNYDIYDKDINQIDFDVVNGSVKVAFVPVNVTGVNLDKHILSMKTGETQTLIATVAPDSATDKSLVWTSDNETVATVDENGTVTGIKEGKAKITAVTVDGNFTDSCEVIVSCSHANKSEYAAVDSTCETHGNNLYYVCNDCEKVFKADGVTETTVEDEMLPLADHTYIYIEEDPATHFAPGMKKHYSCDVCFKLFDMDKNEVADSSVLMIPIIPHNYGNWNSDDVNHWRECECGNIADKANHNFAWKTDKPATEYETGLKHEECTVCGAVRSENTVIPKLEHTHAMKHYDAVAATCKTEGNVEYWQCSKCHKNYADANGISELSTVITPINPDNHIGETKVIEKKDAGCETAGYTGDTVCNGCQAIVKKGEKIPEKGHIPGEWVVTTAPTCTEKGVETQECAACGADMGTREIPMKAHTYGSWTVKTAPTCTEKGVEERSCSCGATETREVAAKGHTPGEWVVTTAPTCTEKGVETQKCAVCGADMGTREVPAKGHTAGEWKIVKEATCTEAGEKTSTCTVCNEAFTEEIPALGHKADKWEIVKEATCTEDGKKKAVCTVCAEEFTEVIPALGHTFGEWEVVKEATETEEGMKERVCSVCGETEKEILPKLTVTPDADTPKIPATGGEAVAYSVAALLVAMCIATGAGIVVTRNKKRKVK